MAHSSQVRLALSAFALTLLAACATQSVQPPDPAPARSANVVVWTPDTLRTPTSLGDPIRARAVEAILTTPAPRYTVNASSDQLARLENPFPPKPKTKRAKSRYVGPGEESRRELRAADPTRATQTTIESIDTQTNIDNTGGSLFIPADAHGAAGPNHVVAVTNVSVEFFQKNGTLDLSTSLRTFFNAVAPTTATFDPKVLYDQYEDRWLIVTLERSDSPEFSSILLAVSDDSDPNGAWTQVRIDSSINIDGNDHWFDYPGFAVDDQAVYITGNMFRYFDGSAGQGSFGGVRLFVVDKGTAGGFYDGGASSVSVFDPVPSGAFEVTLQPAHTYGTVRGAVGTWLIGWSGLNAGGDQAYQVLTIEDPLTAPTITADFVFFGNVDAGGQFPPAPQAGTASGGGNVGIATNDRRTLNAVWRDGGLWTAHSYLANSAPDNGQVTAAWARLDTSGAAPALDQWGFTGGEDVAPGSFTFFPSVAVNDDGGMLLGFSASAPSINAGTYYAYRTPTDPANTLRESITIRPGLDYYQRTFGGPDNRWGDYSSAALDPDGACFWVYNKYAINRGTSTGPGDDGRWGTAFAQFCNDAPVGTADAADVDQGETVSVLASGQASVLANDSDPDASDTLVVTTTPVSGPDHASAFSINLDGTFSYTHDGTNNLSDTIVYEVCDDGSPIACGTAALQITIAPGVNNPPDAIDDSATVAEGATVAVLDSSDASVLDNDSDPDGDSIAVNGAANPAPMHAASFTLNPDGTFSYTHNGSETSADSFGYEVCDDGTPVECTTATVSISITEVNDPPSAAADMLDAIAEDSGMQVIPASALTANDDPGPGEGSQSLTVTAVSNPMGGTVALNGSNVEFTPAADYNGPAGFEYQVTDNGTTNGNPAPASALATAMFVITEVNDPPSAVGETLADVTEDAGTQLIPAATLLGNDDPGPGEGSQTLTITAVSNPVGGTVVLNGPNIEFTPTADYNGPASFDYEATDDGTTDGSPDPLAGIATADFTVTPVNDPPVAVPDQFQIDIEQTLNGDVSVNDSDIDSPTLTFTEDTPPASGSLTLNSDGTFEYVPAAGVFGDVTFVYAVSDGALSDTATVTVNVTDVLFEDGFETTP